MSFRTDRNNNPTAFTMALAAQALAPQEWEQGEPFQMTWGGQEHVLYTAKLIGDPVALTIKVIDKLGFQTINGGPRWSYIDLPNAVWNYLTPELKRAVIGLMYKHEGGTELAHYFSTQS